jgi:hypothetical protein
MWAFSVHQYRGVYDVGYCLLGRVAVLLCNELPAASTHGLPDISFTVAMYDIGVGIAYRVSSLFENKHVRSPKLCTSGAQERLFTARRCADNWMINFTVLSIPTVTGFYYFSSRLRYPW